MQVDLQQLKRKKICPVLSHHEWDYTEQSPQTEFFRFCISEMMRWKGRKGRGISYEILSSLISHFAAKQNVDRVEVGNLQLALKNFTNSGLYSRIEDVISSAEIQVGIGNGHVITHTVPALAKSKDQDKTCIISWDDRIRTREDLMQSYESRLSAVWSFYQINRYPYFYNLYLDEGKVGLVRFKPNQYYIRDCRTFILKMQNLIEDDSLYPAPLETCSNCYRRDECLTTKVRIRNSQKSL